MDKKTIAIIVIVLAIVACAYQFVYVPYQNEQANQNYNKGLQNVSAILEDVNQSMSKIDNVDSSNPTQSLEVTRDTMKESRSKMDSLMEALNQTRQYSNGNKTKEKYIDLLMDGTKIEEDLTDETIQQYTEFIDAYKKMDYGKVLNISAEMQNNVNKKAEEINHNKDEIVKLLNDNPEFNQTLHGLNLSDPFYNHTHVSPIK